MDRGGLYPRIFPWTAGVLAGAVVGCRIAGSFGISIVAGIDHLVVGCIVSDYRRRASCGGGGGVSGLLSIMGWTARRRTA